MNLGMYHLHKRRRVSRGLEAFPSPKAARRAFDYLMYAVGLVQPLALLPQIGAIYLDHQKMGVSITTWLLLTGFNILWAFYGYLHRDTPIMTANILLTMFDAAIVLGVLYY